MQLGNEDFFSCNIHLKLNRMDSQISIQRLQPKCQHRQFDCGIEVVLLVCRKVSPVFIYKSVII